MKEDSCKNCNHWEICKFKPVPYMGPSSGGIKLYIDYHKFANKLYSLYGKYCFHYEGDITEFK